MQTPQATNPIIKIERNDEHYPVRLNDLYDPPPSLYIKGGIHLLRLPMVAIVGSRKASPEGLHNAGLFAKALSTAGVLILSGMAKGVDGAAHRACLGQGPGHFTGAVFGTGINVIYPKQHVPLAQAIVRQGVLLSELPPGAGPKPFNFPRRNRIIAAMAIGVIVVEAAEKSGSLITARLAAELGREVFAVPGSIQNPLSEGCHLLIQQGAKLVRKPKDVLEDLHL
jgi:DNA processing protein